MTFDCKFILMGVSTLEPAAVRVPVRFQTQRQLTTLVVERRRVYRHVDTTNAYAGVCTTTCYPRCVPSIGPGLRVGAAHRQARHLPLVRHQQSQSALMYIEGMPRGAPRTFVNTTDALSVRGTEKLDEGFKHRRQVKRLHFGEAFCCPLTYKTSVFMLRPHDKEYLTKVNADVENLQC